MIKFKCGDLVIIKPTIGDTNEVCKVVFVRVVIAGTGDIPMYKLSNGSYFEGDLLKLFNPKTDLEGGYMKPKYGLTEKITDKEMLLYINNLAYYYWIQGSEDTEQNWLDAEQALKLVLNKC